MDLFKIDTAQLRIFMMVLLRCSVILAVMPFFGSRNWPALAKAGLVLMLALAIFPVVRSQAADWPHPRDVLDLALLAISEGMIALVLGLTVNLIMAGIQMGGQLVGFQLGFGIANVIDPQSGAQVSILSQVAYLVALLVFLNLDGHHWFIRALADSFNTVRPGTFVLSSGLLQQTLDLGAQLFSLAIRIVAPAVAALLFVHTALGIIAKAVPQINVLLMSFPITIGVGLFFFGLSLSLLANFMDGFVGTGLGTLFGRALREMGGGQ
jgi:flagellar biosynthetic protein FliR